MSIFTRFNRVKKTPVAQTPPASMVSLTKKAAVSLAKHGLANQRAAVYLVLDHSGSMERYYTNGDVPHLADQALALSIRMDDDGVAPMLYFSSVASGPVELTLGNHTGTVVRTHLAQEWGMTNYASAMDMVATHYRGSLAHAPALVIFQTDGEPTDREQFLQRLKRYAKDNIFWAFVTFGDCARGLDTLLAASKATNVSVFHAKDPKFTDDAVLYDGITSGFAKWVKR